MRHKKGKHKKKNKKGISDLLLITVWLLVTVIACSIIILVFKEMMGDVGDDLLEYNADTIEIKDTFLSTLSTIDYWVAFAWFGLILGAGVLSYRLRTSPIFGWIAIILLIVMVTVSALMSNVWHEFELDSSITSGTSAMPLSSLFLGLLPLWSLIIGCMIMFITYALGGDDG